MVCAFLPTFWAPRLRRHDPLMLPRAVNASTLDQVVQLCLCFVVGAVNKLFALMFCLDCDR
jgi:hypothetical protein